MGHTHLGSIPKTRGWRDVVSFIGGSSEEAISGTSLVDDIEVVASKALTAAESGLNRAVKDPGLCYSFFLLTQIVSLAQDSQWEQALSRLGISLSEESTIFELAAEIQYHVDDYLTSEGIHTDASEMAQKALVEALNRVAGPLSETLFGSRRDDLQIAMRHLSTKKGFSDIGQAFFSSFLAHFLNFQLSKITAAQTGVDRIRQIGEVTLFNEALRLHCDQTSVIVHDFCGQWYSKTRFEQGINLQNTSRFVAVAVKKLQSELRRQGGLW